MTSQPNALVFSAIANSNDEGTLAVAMYEHGWPAAHAGPSQEQTLQLAEAQTDAAS